VTDPNSFEPKVAAGGRGSIRMGEDQKQAGYGQQGERDAKDFPNGRGPVQHDQVLSQVVVSPAWTRATQRSYTFSGTTNGFRYSRRNMALASWSPVQE